MLLLSWGIALPLSAQEDDDEITVLDPFEVSADEVNGYAATTTMAGTRINTQLRDIGSAISVITEEFMRDTGATDNETLLQYTTNTEVGSVGGNFTNISGGTTAQENGSFLRPHQSTRVRGLAAADNTRNFFLTEAPWDGYNVDRVDMQRGPNAILFGLGSPAGVINASTISAHFENEAELEFRIGSHGSTRLVLDVNRVLIEDQVGIRVAYLNKDKNYQQHPAFDDDDRIFATLRIEPEALNRDGMSSKLKLNYENGTIDRNRPRAITPNDNITPWFGGPTPADGLRRQTFTPIQVQGQQGVPNTGQARTDFPDPEFQYNPWHEPHLGNMGQIFGGPIVFFGDESSPNNTGNYLMSEYENAFGIAPDGSIDGTIGVPFARHVGVGEYLNFAKNVRILENPNELYHPVDNPIVSIGLPFSDFGQYKNIHLTDPTIFDFYNYLLDGPNKQEWADFENFSASWDQTFFNGNVGYEAVYDKQNYSDGQLSFMQGWRQGINIDINNTFLDGTPNPNVGRPFISESFEFGNNHSEIDRENLRWTGFLQHDFRDMDEDSTFFRLLARHVITGLYVRDRVQDQRIGFRRYGTSDEYGELIGVANEGDNKRQLNHVSYLGPSLLNASSASGANIPALSAIQLPQSGTISAWNSRWNAGEDVNPADPWLDPRSVTGDFPTADPEDPTTWSTQSENPANYVGWENVPFQVIENNDGSNPDLAREGRLTKNEIKSKAGVWQGFFLDGGLVGMYGYREDTARFWGSQATVDNGVADLSTLTLPDSPDNVVEGITRSASLVAHLDRFIDPGFGVSLFYNESRNFQPAANRVDVLGNPLPSPSGQTEDYGFILSTHDNKYSLKVNWYETSINNATNTTMASRLWAVGIVENWAYNWATIFQADVHDAWKSDYGQGVAVNSPGKPDLNTPELAAAFEQAATDAYLANLPPQQFWDAWNVDTSEQARIDGIQTAQQPNGLSATSDTLSEGIEFEIVAQPTPNWRIAINAAKTDAINDNVGGAVAEYIESRIAVAEGPAGDVRIWSGNASAPTYRSLMQQNFLGDYQLMILGQGSSVPELREWRVNVITNYEFKEGRLAGWNIGGGWRYQDANIIGYPLTDIGGDTSFLISRPYFGPSESNFDGWIGYRGKLTDKIDWRIQLNVRNIGVGDELIPLNTQPDGTPAAWRIRPGQDWEITNTFTF